MAKSSFPFLESDRYFTFPPADVSENGIVGVGGNLSPGMLLSAYRQGVFPWFSEGDPIIWWSPEPRFILETRSYHMSRSLKRLLKRRPFEFSTDRAFAEVIKACSSVPRPGQEGTWITRAMLEGYQRLHELGHAHSIEVWKDAKLVGGLYGVSVGSMFAGESMFALVDNASKAALALLVSACAHSGIEMIDCQIYTPHLEDAGAINISRNSYLIALKRALLESGADSFWSAGKGVAAVLYDTI